jgi:hypothetical protein
MKNSSFVTYFMLVSCFAFSLTLKMEELCSSETLIDRQQITWSYIRKIELVMITAVSTLNAAYILMLIYSIQRLHILIMNLKDN